MVYYHSSGESVNKLHVVWMPMPYDEYSYPGATRCITWFDKPIEFVGPQFPKTVFADFPMLLRK